MAARPKKSRARKRPPGARVPPPGTVSVPPKRMVIFVHGILSPGFWMNTLRPLFLAEQMIVRPIGFHVLDIFRFLFGRRRQAIDRVKQQIQSAVAAHPDAELTIIAHSFGTYVVSRILDEDFSIKLTRLIMCGGIVPRDYRWDKVARFNSQNANANVDIVNEISGRDRWPIMARHSTYGYGDVGTIGCQDNNVQDRRHYIPHSGYLTATFAQQYWIPFFNPAPQQPPPITARRSSCLLALNWLPARAISFVLAGLLAFGLYFVWDRAAYRTNGTFKIPNTRNVGFEVLGYKSTTDRNPEVVYSARNSAAAGKYYAVHDLASDNRYLKIVVNVFNRRPFECRLNLSGVRPLEEQGSITSPQIAPVWDKDQAATTRYVFDLSNAYRNFGKAKLDFDYNDDAALDEFEGFRADKLTVSAGGRLDPNGVRLELVEHSSDMGKCANDGRTPEGISPFVKTAWVKDESQGILAFWINKAWAQDTQLIEPGNIETLLNDPNPERRAVAVDAIIATPERFAKKARDIVETSSNADAIADVMRASRNVLPLPIRLDEARVLRLAYAGSPKVRDAARSYLRAPTVVSPKIAALFEGAVFPKLIEELRGKPVDDRPYSQDYLLLITARDVFYNLGLKELIPVLEGIRENKKTSSDGQETMLKRFDAGIALRGLAKTPDERIALSKNSYGKALVLLELAVNKEAVSNSSKMDVFEYISTARKEQRKLADFTVEKEVVTQFVKFLDEIGTQRDLYPWPLHIEQAKRCRDKLTFACLGSQTAE